MNTIDNYDFPRPLSYIAMSRRSRKHSPPRSSSTHSVEENGGKGRHPLEPTR